MRQEPAQITHAERSCGGIGSRPAPPLAAAPRHGRESSPRRASDGCPQSCPRLRQSDPASFPALSRSKEPARRVHRKALCWYRAARVYLCDKRAVDHVRLAPTPWTNRSPVPPPDRVGRCSRSQGQSSASTAPACRRVPAPPMRLRRLDHPFPKAPSCPHPLDKSESCSAALDGR